jgi:hypothetical protein
MAWLRQGRKTPAKLSKRAGNPLSASPQNSADTINGPFD